MKNRIYFFTGTGNSLNVAKRLSESLDNCELVPITAKTNTKITGKFERIGFVFPCYAGGPPKMVAEFIKKLEYNEKQNVYHFAITTAGGNVGSCLSITNSLFINKNLKLNFGGVVISFPNAVTLYPMIRGVWIFNKISEKRIKRYIKDIGNKKEVSLQIADEEKFNKYETMLGKIQETSKEYAVNDDCISCGRCVKLCPACNIELEDSKKPIFLGKCESCMACIQHCPKKAINYRDKTQKRRRYVNPNINVDEIIKHYSEMKGDE